MRWKFLPVTYPAKIQHRINAYGFRSTKPHPYNDRFSEFEEKWQMYVRKWRLICNGCLTLIWAACCVVLPRRWIYNIACKKPHVERVRKEISKFFEDNGQKVKVVCSMKLTFSMCLLPYSKNSDKLMYIKNPPPAILQHIHRSSTLLIKWYSMKPKQFIHKI